MCCLAKMTFNKSHIDDIGMCMVTKWHFINVKIFSGNSWGGEVVGGQERKHGQLPPFSLVPPMLDARNEKCRIAIVCCPFVRL